ncbi:rRNA processing protein [Apiospora aurea]|uniref:Pre-rRNA-processing protein n=1 Tax=Apiospora aurea TaxID=335848 RepID=A0ABR1Q4E7_9PEZI
MGSSNRKKAEKKKDFAKPKLKVGKAKAKPDNFTDTSFKSKAIVINKQLTEDAPDANDRFKHFFSLAGSRSDTQRRDALAYLTSQLSTTPPTNPVGTHTLLNKILPLMTDISKSVRAQLLKLLKALPADEVAPHVEKVILYIRGAMTHITQDIKDDGLNYMEWLLDVAGDSVVSGAGCWVKPLKDLTSVLGWTGGWTSAPRTTFGAKKHGQAFPRQMLVLSKFLEYGFKAESPRPWVSEDWLGNFCRLPTNPDPYGYLGLFKPPRDEDGEIYRNREDRQDVYQRRFGEAIATGVDAAKKEGGLAGRAAATLDKVLREGMGDYEITSRTDDDDERLWAGYIM